MGAWFFFSKVDCNNSLFTKQLSPFSLSRHFPEFPLDPPYHGGLVATMYSTAWRLDGHDLFIPLHQHPFVANLFPIALRKGEGNSISSWIQLLLLRTWEHRFVMIIINRKSPVNISNVPYSLVFSIHIENNKPRQANAFPRNCQRMLWDLLHFALCQSVSEASGKVIRKMNGSLSSQCQDEKVTAHNEKKNSFHFGPL